MTTLRGLVSALLLPVSLGAVLAGSPAHAATTITSAEGERMTASAGSTAVLADAAASGGSALELLTNGTVDASLTPPVAQQLVLRLRGAQYRGAPQAVVRVDGRQVASFAVSATAWTNYPVTASWTAARHLVQISFTNNLYDAGGDRNLYVDKLWFASTQATPAPAAVNDTYESRIVELVNIERAKVGLRALTVSTCADRYAEEWSDHMAATGLFAHRADLLAPMTACGAHAIGENIAYGNITADEMMTNWMNSPGHRANILNATFTQIGVGATTTATGRVYGTQNLLG